MGTMSPLTLTLSPETGTKGRGWITASLLILGVLALHSALQAAPAAAPAQTILVFGDSVSAGYGMRVEQGWVALLQKKLRQAGYAWQVVNASVSGETTEGGKARLPRALKLHKPQIVILELGANDGLRGLPLEGMRTNLEAMVATIRESGAQVLLVSVPLPANYGKRYTEGFQTVFRLLSERNALALVPFVIDNPAARKALLQSDGLHPNARAQPRLRDAVWPALIDLIKKTS